MAVIAPSIEISDYGTAFKWSGMMGNAVLADCDVGEPVEIAQFTERSLQISGLWNNNRFALHFSSDLTMPWNAIVPLSGILLITPGRSYAAPPAAVWPASRFFRPAIQSVYMPDAPGLDVILFCTNRIT